MTRTAIITKQPRGLYILFFAEMWERYGFYTMQNLLVLFLVKHFGFNDAKAYALFGGYSALIYLMPVIGGYLADKLLGFRRAIYVGSIFYVVGFFGLAIFGAAVFYHALACLIIGSGFFKGNVSSLLGTFYEKNDIRRDGGFTWFYLGINIGSLLASVISSYLVVKFNWFTAFGVAGLGMLVGLLNNFRTFSKLGDHGLPPNASHLKKRIAGVLSYENLIYILAIITALIIAVLLKSPALLQHIYTAFSILVLLFLFILAFRSEAIERNKMFALIILLFSSVLFWALYSQTWSSLTLFTERSVDRNWFDVMIPTAAFIGLNPFFIVVLSPIFAWLWVRMGKKNRHISIPTKFSLGLIFVGLSFAVLKLGIVIAGQHLTNPLWLVFSYFLQVCGELSLSPIGLSMITVLAPKKYTGMMMGVWFLSLAMGFGLGSELANLADIPKNLTDSLQIADVYGHAFSTFAWMTLIAGLIVAALVPWLNRLSGPEARN